MDEETLDRIARHCPRALSAYLMLAIRADEDGQVSIHKDQINKDLSESYIKFRNDIRMLARENLLEWHEIDDRLHIILVLPEE